MKKILTILVCSILLFGCVDKQRYCGNVVQTFRTDAGYKSSPEAHVIFYCDSLKRNVDVEVTWNCYANSQVGKRICFQLYETDLNK